MLIKVVLFFLLFQRAMFGAEYAVIVNKNSSITTVSVKQIKNIYMKKKHFLNQIKIFPVNISSSSKIRNNFEKQVLHLSRHKLNRYWIKQHFQGVRPPVVQSSIKAMKLFVKNVDGAIGYIPVSNLDKNLKVLYEF
jgi:ABC-type phosphate transport system substrate-binding protein